jgi:cell division protein FtsW (lipid II flippase)
MATHTGLAIRRGSGVSSVAATQVAWFVAGLVLTFLVPFTFSSVLNLQHDLYLLVYFVVVSLFLAAYVVQTRAPVAEIWTRG